jgi:hypothetical protein
MIWTNLTLLLPVGFKGPQTGIGSWFRSKNAQDSTNGNSWCGYPYLDTSPVFAPDISQMTQGSNAVWPNPLWSVFASQYCGLEARVTNLANNRTLIMWVGDAFDHKWVRSPGSIDIMTHHYALFNNTPMKYPTDKNKVYRVRWEFTGNRNPQYMFKGIGH